MHEKIGRFPLIPVLILAGLVIIGVVSWLLVSTPWLSLALVPGVLAGIHYHAKLSKQWRMAYAGFLIIVITVFGGHMLRTMRGNINAPSEWDFKSFWLNGRVGIQGVNFYNPEYFREEAIPLNPSESFTEQIIDPGFWYPPFSILLFLPLGWFNLQTALLLWYIFLSAILLVDIWLIWKTFLPDTGWIGLGAAAALTLLLHGTWANYFYGQSGFLLLLMLLLSWRDRDLPRAGIWLALGILVKPLIAFMLLYLVLRKYWRAIAAMVGTLAGVSLIVIAMYGLETFFSYNPITKLPSLIYSEWVNQGLLATILRVTNYDFSTRSPITHPLFLFIGVLSGVITSWLVYKLPKSEKGWAWSLVLVLALLLYPTTLTHYSLLLALPLFLIWKTRRDFFGGVWGAVVFITAEYFIMNISDGSNSFMAFALLWIVLVAIAGRELRTTTISRPIYNPFVIMQP